MASVSEAIRRLSIITVEKGTPEATAKLHALGAAHSGVAVESRKHVTATAQMERQLASLQRRLDPTFRAVERLAQADRTLNAAQAQGLITMARRNELMALATKEHTGAAAATTAHARALAVLNAQGALAGRAVLGGLGLAGGPVTAGVLVAGLTLAAFVKNSVEAQKSLAQLEAVLRSTGGAAGLTAGDLTNLATEMQRVTTFGDDAVIGTEALLLTFTKIRRDVFPAAIRSILDMSIAMNQDLKSSTIQLGKALNDPIAGITALARAGVTFTAAQKLMIKALVDVGDVAGAQTIILRELQTEFGGSAAAARDTLGGALTALGNSFGDLFEVSGKGSKALTDSINGLTETLSDPATIKAIQDFGAALFDALAASLKVMTFLVDKIGAAARLMQAFASGPAEVGRVLAEMILMEEAAQETASTADVMAQRFDDAFARSTAAATGTTTAIDAAREAIRQATVGAVLPMSDALEGRFTDAFSKAEKAAEKAAKAVNKAVGNPLDIRPAIARTEVATDGLNDRLLESRNLAEGFTKTLIQGLMQGESFTKSLGDALTSLSATLADAALTDLFSGNFIGAAIKGVGALVSGLFGGDGVDEKAMKKREALEAAQSDIADFRAMLAGETTTALAGTIREVTEKVADYVKLLSEAGAKIQAGKLQDDLAKWKKTLDETFNTDVLTKFRAATGRSYLNEGSDLAKEVEAFRKDARMVGGDLTLVDRYAVAAAQGIVDQYELTGKAFDNFMRTLPGLTGRVHEFVEAAEKVDKAAIKGRMQGFLDRLFDARNDTTTLAGQLKAFDRAAARERKEEIAAGGHALALLEKTLAAERLNIVRDFNRDALEEQKRAAADQRAALNQSAQSIVDYVNSLRAGPETTLSPQDRLATAQSAYNAQIALAQGGNADAQSTITQYADDFIKAARDFYASSVGFQTIFQQVQDQLLALPAVEQATDPVVVALRDVLLGVDAVTAAINLMSATLRTAIDAGPVATATALGAAFEEIDVNVSGGISFGEMQTALNGLATNAELHGVFSAIDLNRNETISKLELLLAEAGLTRTQLKAAVTAGPAGTASLLSTYFTTLDTTMKGRLSFDEMKSALGGIASDAQLLEIFTELDDNGNDTLSKLELVRAAGAGTKKAVNDQDKLLSAVKGNTQASENELVALKNINKTSGKELTALKNINTSTKSISDTISTSLLKLGKQDSAIANHQANAYFTPMRVALKQNGKQCGQVVQLV